MLPFHFFLFISEIKAFITNSSSLNTSIYNPRLTKYAPCSFDKFYKEQPEKVKKLLKFGLIGYEVNINIDDIENRSEKYINFRDAIERRAEQAGRVTVISSGMDSLSFEFANVLKDRVEPSVIIYVNWDALNGDAWVYPRLARHAPLIGRWTGLLIKTLANDGAIDVSKLTGIGYSLGAHILGNMGNYLTENNLKMAHIIALDPAGPCFQDWYKLRAVQRSDAKLVQVIHTNTKSLGYKRSIGHIDIYPNNGNGQPGCKKWQWMVFRHRAHSCDHSYAVKLFKQENIVASCAKSWKEFKNDNIQHTITIGQDLNSEDFTPKCDGNYYLKSPNLKFTLFSEDECQLY